MDRTSEFLRLTATAASLSSSSTSSSSSKPKAAKVETRSAFHDAAADIARGVHRTSGVLARLAKLVRRQGLFDDPTEEINNLIYRIKQDLDELNTKCDSAQQYVENKKRSLGEKNQSASHNTKVVSQLKTDLMTATKDFKSVLEMRSSKMKDQQVRKVELTGEGVLSPMRQFHASQGSSSSSGAGGRGRGGAGEGASQRFDDEKGVLQGSQQQTNRDSNGGMKMMSPYNHTLATGAAGNQPHMNLQQQQLLLAPPQASQYYDQREQAVTEVEKTIGELGTLFKRLTTMIHEQQELVERIDDDIEASVNNAERAHSILLKTYESVSSNRTLYMKIGAILAIFIVFFSIFLM